jgi:hypothetical protein
MSYGSSYHHAALLYSGHPESRAFRAAALSLEPFTLIIRSLPVRPAKRISSPVFSFRRGLLLALLTTVSTLAVAGCGTNLYQFPEYNFAGRPVPPSLLSNRVMVALTTGVQGSLQILDAQRDIRNSVYNANKFFSISGFSGNNPQTILSFPDELKGYVYTNASPWNITVINYGTEAAGGSAAQLNTPSNSFDTSADFVRLYSAQEETGQLFISDASLGQTFTLNLPNVYQVYENPGDTVALAMVRNSNTLYRVVKLNSNSTNPPGAVDCEPTILPVYCVVPVPGTFDRPVKVSYSLDGSTAYVLNCGAECGGGTNGGSGVSLIPQGSLQINLIPTSVPYPAVVTKTIPIPGGVTDALSDGTNLYLAGQQLQPDGLFAGFETTLPLATLVPAAPVSISDGTHTKMIFGDDNTLWIGSSSCANGERYSLFAAGNTTQAANYNCLTRAVLPTSTTPLTAAVVPAVNQGSATVAAVPVPYENQNEDPYYYGSLTGICWVQGLHKMYTAYGGQVHAFETATGTEINNQYITVQGTALDVAYMDANTDTAN